MIILLIIYLIFLAIYFGFNLYVVSRVWAMRLPSDATRAVIAFYLIVIGSIVAISLVAISSVKW